MGRFATGVVVVTGITPGGESLGFTCQSFVPLSIEPMLVSFAAGSAGKTWARMRELDQLAISVLSDTQQEVAAQFAVSGADKYAGVDWVPASNGAPLLTGALAHISGRVVERIEQGDHVVVVLSVEQLEGFDGEPLLYFRSEFRHLT
jgi:flavin reductase (DIM6/NTAB) family NADH-FMN oxidoreductase RutF